MDREIKSRQTVKNVIIACDFAVMNIVLFLFVIVPDAKDDIRTVVEANACLLVAEYFFSTILHRRRTTTDRILRQVSYLTATQVILFFIVSKLGLVYRYGNAPTIAEFCCFAPALYAGMLIARYAQNCIVKHYRSRPENRQRVAFAGADSSMLPIFGYLESDPSMGYSIDGYYADQPADDFPASLRHIGTIAQLKAILDDPAADKPAEVYSSLPVNRGDDVVGELVRSCNRAGIRFYYVPCVSGILGPSFKQERIGETFVFTGHPEPLAAPHNKLIKRTFDIVVSLFALVLTSVLLPFVAAIIKKQSPGPILFKQKRTGLGGEEFWCYKFRSMHVNKDADKLQATEHDPRKFPFGDFMRKTNIDELPQFWNVFIGDMSIVGPRPHMLLHTEQYRKLIDTYMLRHFVRPGVTGWAQVTGYRGETKELWQMEGRVKRDIWYIENWSLWLDIRIIWKTAAQIVRRDKKAY